MERKTTSIKINPELWQDVKIHCIKEKKDISEWLEEIIKENLRPNRDKKNKFYTNIL